MRPAFDDPGRYANPLHFSNLQHMTARPVRTSPEPEPTLLSRAIKATRLSVRQFAMFIIREPRSVYRWLKLPDDALPGAVYDRCREIISTDPADLRKEVDAWIVKQFYQRTAQKTKRP